MALLAPQRGAGLVAVVIAVGLATAAAAVVACSPNIEPGAYACGAQQLCPEDERCTGSDSTCVLAGSEEPFACSGDEASDETPQTGHDFGELACVSLAVEALGCVFEADTIDWYQLEAPATCTAVAADVRLTFPFAWQPLALRFVDLGASGGEAPGPVTTIGAPCPNSSESDDSTQVCALERLVPGHHYAIGVIRDGADCAGACSYNRYVLNLSLQTP